MAKKIPRRLWQGDFSFDFPSKLGYPLRAPGDYMSDRLPSACRTRTQDMGSIDLALLFVIPCLLAALCVEPDPIQEWLRSVRGIQGPNEAKQILTIVLLLCEFFWIGES